MEVEEADAVTVGEALTVTTTDAELEHPVVVRVLVIT